MSAAFQSAVARVLVDRSARQRVREGTSVDGLAPHEADALRHLVDDPGLVVTAKLIASFRLGKVLALLPMTREVLGNERLADELDRFWLDHPPVSFYVPDEVAAFCDHLERRLASGDLDVPELGVVVALERAQISALREHPNGDQTSP